MKNTHHFTSSIRGLCASLIPSLVLILGMLGCCNDNQGSSTPTSSAAIPYVMAPLDTVRITERDGSVRELTVQQDGSIDLPSGSRRVKGISVVDFRTMVSRSYPSAGRIEILEFRPNRITVLGEVFHQIDTELPDGPMRVMDAIAAANGFTPLANARRVRLVRENAGTSDVYELDLRQLMKGRHLDQNILLCPGDVITVPKNFL